VEVRFLSWAPVLNNRSSDQSGLFLRLSSAIPLPVQPRPARPGPATANCTPTTLTMASLPCATRKPPGRVFFPASAGTIPSIRAFGRASDGLLQPARAAPGRRFFRSRAPC